MCTCRSALYQPRGARSPSGERETRSDACRAGADGDPPPLDAGLGARASPRPRTRRPAGSASPAPWCGNSRIRTAAHAGRSRRPRGARRHRVPSSAVRAGHRDPGGPAGRARPSPVSRSRPPASGSRRSARPVLCRPAHRPPRATCSRLRSTRRRRAARRATSGVRWGRTAVGQLERIRPVRRHEPELIPLAAEIGAVHHPAAVAAPVGPPLPGRLLVPDLARSHHPGEPASARSHRSPRRGPGSRPRSARRPSGDQVGESAWSHGVVVVPREAALVVLADPLDPFEPSVRRDIGGEDVPPAFIQRGREGQPPAVRRPARLEVTAPPARSCDVSRWGGRAAEARSRRPGTRRTRCGAHRATSRADSRIRARR